MSTEKVRVRVLHSAWAPSPSRTCCWRRPRTRSSSDSSAARPQVNRGAERENVEIRLHSIIYELRDEMKGDVRAARSVFKENYAGKPR